MFIPASRLAANRLRNVQDISDLAMNIASEVEVELGVYKRRTLLARKKVLNSNGTVQSIQDVIITPTPRISFLGPKLASLFSNAPNLQLKQDDYLVTGLPTSYDYDELFKNVEYFIIDPAFNTQETQIIGGQICKPIMRLEQKITSRRFILRKEADTNSNKFPLTYYPPT